MHIQHDANIFISLFTWLQYKLNTFVNNRPMHMYECVKYKRKLYKVLYNNYFCVHLNKFLLAFSYLSICIIISPFSQELKLLARIFLN